MDEHDKSEEQVEDLDTPESEAEEVKGGFSWGVSNPTSIKEIGAKGEFGDLKQRGFDGNTNQHNETLIAL